MERSCGDGRLVTVMSDGRRIDTADKLREVIAEFEDLQREKARTVDAEDRS